MRYIRITNNNKLTQSHPQVKRLDNQINKLWKTLDKVQNIGGRNSIIAEIATLSRLRKETIK